MTGKRFGRDPFLSISILGASSVLVTSLIFHIASIWIVHERQDELFGQVKIAMEQDNSELFKGFCVAAGARCGSGSEVDSVLEAMPELGRQQARSSLEAVKASGPGSFASWKQSFDDKTFNRLPSMAAAVGVAPTGDPRIWIDVKTLPRFLLLGEKVFALLALCAHGLWLWGSIFLGLWHEKMVRAKARTILAKKMTD